SEDMPMVASRSFKRIFSKIDPHPSALIQCDPAARQLVDDHISFAEKLEDDPFLLHLASLLADEIFGDDGFRLRPDELFGQLLIRLLYSQIWQDVLIHGLDHRRDDRAAILHIVL